MGWFIQLLVFIGTTLLSKLLAPKPDVKAAGLEEFEFPTATEDRKNPVLWGTCEIAAPNVAWHGDLKTKEIKEGWSIAKKTIGHQYSLGIQFAICRGPIDQINRIWVGDQIIYDTPITSAGRVEIKETYLWGGYDIGANGGLLLDLDVHFGISAQAVDSYLLTQQGGASKTPAYRGSCYITSRGPSTGYWYQPQGYEYVDINGNTRRTRLDKIYWGYLGNSISTQPWKFEVCRWPNGLGLTGGKEEVGDGGANPANVLYEIITNTEWGMGLPPSSIDTTNFTTAANTFYTEGNGFSSVMYEPADLDEIIRQIEKQTDCFCHFNRVTGKWEINLVRGGYSVGSLQLFDKTNCEVIEWKTQVWEDTINQVFVKFSMFDANARHWKKTSTPAMNQANYRIQGDYKPEDIEYPGCRDPVLAKILAARDLRTLSSPLRRGALAVDLEAYDLNPGDVIKFTWVFDSGETITELPLRINAVHLGEPDDSKMRLDVTEDIFYYDADGTFGTPPDTEWTPPVDDLGPIPTDEDQVFELPRALAVRGEYPESLDRLYFGARDQEDGMTSVRVMTRHASGTPSGAYAEDANRIIDFLVIGKLYANLAQNTSNPTATGTEDIRVDPDDNDVDEILATFDTTLATAGDLGQSLVNLIVIGNEIMAVTQVIDNTTYVTLRTVYRGFLDTVPAPHSANDKVFVLKGIEGVTIYPRTHNVDVQLRPTSQTDDVGQTEANTVQLQMADRGRAPYPTTDLEVNSTRYSQSTESLDDTTSGTGLDQVGLNIEATFRDFELYDQVQSLSAGLTYATYNSQVQVRVTDDPGGTPDVLFTTALIDANPSLLPILLSRTRILAETDGEIPSTLRIETIMQHTVPDPEGGPDLDLNDLFHDTLDVDVSSAALSGLENTGARAINTASTPFTADVSGTYVFTIGTSVLTSGKVQAKIGAGSWQDVILTGNTTGTLAGVTASDQVYWQHTQSGSSNLFTHLRIQQQSGSVDEAYGILIV